MIELRCGEKMEFDPHPFTVIGDEGNPHIPINFFTRHVIYAAFHFECDAGAYAVLFFNNY